MIQEKLRNPLLASHRHHRSRQSRMASFAGDAVSEHEKLALELADLNLGAMSRDQFNEHLKVRLGGPTCLDGTPMMSHPP